MVAIRALAYKCCIILTCVTILYITLNSKKFAILADIGRWIARDSDRRPADISSDRLAVRDLPGKDGSAPRALLGASVARNIVPYAQKKTRLSNSNASLGILYRMALHGNSSEGLKKRDAIIGPASKALAERDFSQKKLKKQAAFAAGRVSWRMTGRGTERRINSSLSKVIPGRRNGDEHRLPIQLPLCPILPSALLGRLNISLTIVGVVRASEEHEYSISQHWVPRDCRSRQSVAIIVPYRDRQTHLNIFLRHLHPILRRQKVAYTIYVIEQVSPYLFNRGALMNAGFVQARQTNPLHDCFIFHDVDLLPEDDRHLYRCYQHPMHMGAYVSTKGYTPMGSIVGGVLAIRPTVFQAVNGFSNTFWGWGGEDDDMYNRLCNYRQYKILRPNSVIGRYFMLQHDRDVHNPKNPDRFRGLRFKGTSYLEDGVGSVIFRVVLTENQTLHTRILVKLSQNLDWHEKAMGALNETVSPILLPNSEASKSVEPTL